MADDCINQYSDPDMEVTKNKVVSCKPQQMRYLEKSVNLLKILAIAVVCTFDGCRVGHCKYGLHVASNQPCVFDCHDNEGVWYVPNVTKANRPLRIPADGDVLLSGIRWNTTTPRDQQLPVANSCMIDGFLTDLKVRSLDPKFCFECLFTYDYGAGRDLEQCLRTLISHILVFAKPLAQSHYKRVRVFSYEDDLRIKRIWLDKEALQLVPQYNFRTGRYDQDLMYRPKAGGRDENLADKHGSYFGIQVSMDFHVLRRLDTVTRIKLTLGCGCSYNETRFTNCFIFVDKGSKYIAVAPAMRNFDSLKMEFDEGYIETVLMQTGVVPSFKKALPPILNFSSFARPVRSQKCHRCAKYYSTKETRVPSSTWMLIVEFPDSLKKVGLHYIQKVVETRINNVVFYLGWLQLLEAGNHMVSIHHFNDRWFYYDDLPGGNMIRIKPKDFELGSREFLRAYYYRVPSRNPHECLVRMATAESTVQID